METSAGIAIIYKDMILLGHPTRSKYFGTWSIPKGHVEKGESLQQAAIRETFEEVGIKLSINRLSPTYNVIPYYSKQNKIKKICYCFVVYIDTLEEIGLSELELPNKNINTVNIDGIQEIDKAKFVDIEVAEKLMFWRQLPLLHYIREQENNLVK